MAGCGYVCPACEGRGLNEEGNPCDWCSVEINSEEAKEAEEEN